MNSSPELNYQYGHQEASASMPINPQVVPIVSGQAQPQIIVNQVTPVVAVSVLPVPREALFNCMSLL